MARSDPIQKALDRLGELRHAEPSTAVIDELRAFLRNRSNLVVAKAATVVRDLKITTLVPELVAGFNKFMADAPRLDKRCAALTEIASALYELDYDDPGPYLTGIKHVQLEGSYGPPVDEGAKLRAISAQGLLRTRYADALSEMVQLLVDREPAARIGAVRGLSVNGGEAGVLMLRLKVLTGDPEPAVIGECFAGLLAASPQKSVAFVGKYLDVDDDATREAATLALGESRLPAAYELLKEKWDRTAMLAEKKVLLVSMAASRLDDAIAFLISLVESAGMPIASAAGEALSIYRRNERISKSVYKAIQERRDHKLIENFRRDFGSVDEESASHQT
jgi:hypothetical protein